MSLTKRTKGKIIGTRITRIECISRECLLLILTNIIRIKILLEDKYYDGPEAFEINSLDDYTIIVD